MQPTTEMMKPIKRLLKTYPQKMQTEQRRHRQQTADVDANVYGADKAQTQREPQAVMAMVTAKLEVLLKLLAFLSTI